MNKFGIHPSLELNEAYKKKYWQVQNPKNARILFLGLDANWELDIETNDTDILKEVLEYLNDGVTYWKQKGYHHPFLSKRYNKGDGYTYHSRFLKMGITSEYADEISFIELLNVPTYGMSSKSTKLFDSLLDIGHLRELDGIIFNKKPKIVFLPKSLYEKIKIIRKKLKLNSLFNFETELEQGINYNNKLMNIHRSGDVFVFVHTHFSNAISDKHITNVGSVAKSFLKNSNVMRPWLVKIGAEVADMHSKEIYAKDIMELLEIIKMKENVLSNKPIEIDYIGA